MKLSDYNGTTPSDEGRALCPQCHEMLELIDRATVVGYGCPSCGGIWLDSATTARVETTLDTQTIQVGEVAAGIAENAFPPHAASPPCPLCQTPMRSYVVPGSDIEVDACAAHGTWFDRGELQTLIRELMDRVHDVAAESSLPVADVRQKMIDKYGIDPTLTPGELPAFLKDMIDFWELIRYGKVLPGNRD